MNIIRNLPSAQAMEARGMVTESRKESVALSVPPGNQFKKAIHKLNPRKEVEPITRKTKRPTAYLSRASHSKGGHPPRTQQIRRRETAVRRVSTGSSSCRARQKGLHYG